MSILLPVHDSMMRSRKSSAGDDETLMELLPQAPRSSINPVAEGTRRDAAKHSMVSSNNNNSDRLKALAHRYRWPLGLGLLLCALVLFTSQQASSETRRSRTTLAEHLSSFGSSRYLSPEEAFEEQDGLLFLQDRARPDNIFYKSVHPIIYLMKRAKEEWQNKLASQSKTLEEAVRTYEIKYGRPPPKGFDKWWGFAQDNHVLLVDNYDQIYRDMLPFLGLPSEPLKRRSTELVDDPGNYYYQGSFTFHIVNGAVADVSGGKSGHKRVEEQLHLLDRIVKYLPDMNITIWAHDTPVMHVAGEKRQELEDLARLGKTLPENRWGDWGDLPEYVGWEAFCLPHSKLRNYIGGIEPPYSPNPSFIGDLYEAIDFCAHPENLPLHSLTGNYGVGPRAVNLSPVFSHCKLSLYSDIAITPLEQFDDDVGPDPEWSMKTDNMVLWRGSTTGSRYDRGIIWRAAQRIRLALLTNSNSEHIRKRIYTTGTDNFTLAAYDENLGHLNKQMFDVLFTGEPQQCNVGDGTCERMKHHLPFASKRMQPQQANQYKYVLDVDGNGWSGRFHRLMRSNAAVLKSTGFTEWWGDRIQPWVHFIPVKLDYSDLHSIASFFVGDDKSPGHDAEGREIGEAGKTFAAQHLRYADMEAYMLRLYLEYARVMGRDPNNPSNMDYGG